MAKFHVNDQGIPGVCTAQVQCRFGGDAQHYTSPEIAQKAYELSMASQSIPEPHKKKSEPTVKMPTSGAYEVGTKAERYVHPQGKMVEINPDGTVTAWKNGKIIPTSATAEKLRKGHGSWKKADPNAGEPKPNMGPPATPVRAPASVLKAQAKSKKLTVEEITEYDRQQELVAKGYPKTSGLNPWQTPRVEDRAPRPDPYRSSYKYGRAVLPTDTRINPHQNPENNEYVETWTKHGQGSIIAIVKQRGETRDIYRSILSGHSGESSDIIGDTFPLEHDQSMTPIGRGDWEVIGVYEPRPGGAVMGEIPNQKIPFYVYK